MSPKMVNPRDIAGNAEEEEKEELFEFIQNSLLAIGTLHLASWLD